jgi:hypothetical protein
MAPKNLAHAIFILKHLIRGGNKTRRPLGHKRETQSWLALLILQHGTISLW